MWTVEFEAHSFTEKSYRRKKEKLKTLSSSISVCSPVNKVCGGSVWRHVVQTAGAIVLLSSMIAGRGRLASAELPGGEPLSALAKKLLDASEVQRVHLEHDAREVRPQDLRGGERVASLVVALLVQPDAHALGDAAAFVAGTALTD